MGRCVGHDGMLRDTEEAEEEFSIFSLSLSLSALSYRTMRCVARIMETNLYAPLACLHAKRASWLIMSAVKIPYDDEVLKHVPGMIEDITRSLAGRHTDLIG